MMEKADLESWIHTAEQAQESDLVDLRKPRGKRHGCALILTMIMVGFLHGRFYIRSIAKLFHDSPLSQELWDLFSPYFDLSEHGFPSYSCVTRFIQTADTEMLANVLCTWGVELAPDEHGKMRLWGVDGQAVLASKRAKDGGRPLYNVDFYDVEGDRLVYFQPVESKSQESKAAASVVKEVLSGHPNVVIMADAMMTKKTVLEEVAKAGCNSIVPVKANNPSLMNGFSQAIEELVRKHPSSIDHYVDLGGAEDGVGYAVISNTVSTYEEEDNKKYGNPKSHPINEFHPFYNLYPYGMEETPAGAEKPPEAEGIHAEEEASLPEENIAPTITEDGQVDVSGDGVPGLSEEEKLASLQEAGEVYMVFVPGKGFENAVVGKSDNAFVVHGHTPETPGTGQEPLPSDTPGQGAMAPSSEAAEEEHHVSEEEKTAKLTVPLRIDPSAKGVWVKVGDFYAVFVPSHGRLERREYELVKGLDSYDIWKGFSKELKEAWEPYVKCIGCATRYRADPVTTKTGTGKNVSKELEYRVSVTRTPYLMTFIPQSAEEFGTSLRLYWGTEGKLHAVVDKLFDQDKCTCRTGNSAGNMSLLKKIGYNVVSAARRAVMKLSESRTPGKEARVAYSEIFNNLKDSPSWVMKLLAGKPTTVFNEYAMQYR